MLPWENSFSTVAAVELYRNNGASIEDVSALLSHRSIATTATYLARMEGEEDKGWRVLATSKLGVTKTLLSAIWEKVKPQGRSAFLMRNQVGFGSRIAKGMLQTAPPMIPAKQNCHNGSEPLAPKDIPKTGMIAVNIPTTNTDLNRNMNPNLKNFRAA